MSLFISSFWHKLKRWMVHRELVPSPQRDKRQEAGSLLWVPPGHFISSDEICPETLNSAYHRLGKSYECILNENDKAVQAGCGLGDTLKFTNIAGLIWNCIIIWLGVAGPSTGATINSDLLSQISGRRSEIVGERQSAWELLTWMPEIRRDSF